MAIGGDVSRYLEFSPGRLLDRPAGSRFGVPAERAGGGLDSAKWCFGGVQSGFMWVQLWFLEGSRRGFGGGLVVVWSRRGAPKRYFGPSVRCFIEGYCAYIWGCGVVCGVPVVAYSRSKCAPAGHNQGANVHKRTRPADRITCQRAMPMTPRRLELRLPG